MFTNQYIFPAYYRQFTSTLSRALITIAKSKAVPLHAMKALGGEEI
jgi:hypothetical protein